MEGLEMQMENLKELKLDRRLDHFEMFQGLVGYE